MNTSDYAYDKQNPTEIIALIMKEMGSPSDEKLCKLLNICSDSGIWIIRDYKLGLSWATPGFSAGLVSQN